MNRICTLTSFLFLLTLVNCSINSNDVTVKLLEDLETNRPVYVQPQTSYWNAMHNFDLDFTNRVQSSEEEIYFRQGLAAILNNDFTKAEFIFKTLHSTSEDSLLKLNATDILQEIYMHQSKWIDYLSLECTHDSMNTKALIEAYAQAPPERYHFPEHKLQLPISIGLAGVPQVEVKVNGTSKKFLIDTGASYTVLASDFAEKCGIQAVNSQIIKSGTSTEALVGIQPAIIDTLEIGDLIVVNHPSMIIDKTDLEFKLLKFIRLLKIDGIIGWHAIKNMKMAINYKDGQLVIEKPVQDAQSTPNLFWLGYPIIRLANINGTSIYLGLDNGANSSSIHSSILNKVDTTGIFIEDIKVGSAGGEIHQYTVKTLPELQLRMPPYQLTFQDIATHPKTDDLFFNLDGIIGSDIAVNGTLVLDFVNGRVDLIINEGK